MNAESTTSGMRAVALAALAACAISGLTVAANRAEGAEAQPNVVFILTDDQAYHEISAMPNVRSLIGAQGATFNRTYIPYPLCCPSRAGLLSGQYMHNHGVRGNGKPYGGWARFKPSEPEALPVATQGAGYYNVHIGKYMNGYATGIDPDPYVPPGWDEWYGKVSETELYYDYRLIEQEGPGDTPTVVFYGDQEADYQTDVLRDKAIDFVEGPEADDPFMLNLWFNAPHGPFVPAPRHLFDYGGAKLPALPGFNERDISDKPSFLQRQAKTRLKGGLKSAIAGERRRRWEMLKGVDEAVGDLIASLEAEGVLQDTFVIFTSDNGFFRGEHRIAGGKYLAYEASSRAPLMIRGPGIAGGVKTNELTSLLDITQTILEVTTGSTDPSLDGRSLLPYAQNPGAATTRPILFEADSGPGRGGPGAGSDIGDERTARRAGIAGLAGVRNLDQEAMATKTAFNGNTAPAYRGIRTNRYLYVLYATGDVELYDMKLDPAQLTSLHNRLRLRPVRKFLFKRLLELAGCEGAACRKAIGPDPKRLSKKRAARIRRARAAKRRAQSRAAKRRRATA